MESTRSLRLVDFWLDDSGRGCSSRRLIRYFARDHPQHDFVSADPGEQQRVKREPSGPDVACAARTAALLGPPFVVPRDSCGR